MRATRQIDRRSPPRPPRAAPTGRLRWVGALLACPAALALAAAPSGTAPAATDALAAIDARLAQNPNDAQWQFRRGVALSAAGRASEAIGVFKRLIEAHPDLAAAYNNLAALQAEQGDDEAARALLQKAVQLRPGYATALHNLGDVHLRLAVAAYGQALKADPNDTVARGRVTSLQFPPDNRASPADAGQPPLVQVAAASSGGRPTTASATPVTSAPAQVGDDTSTADVTAVVRNWADDWSRRDASAYIGYYAPDFKGRAANHAEWVAERKAKLTRPARIRVALSNLVVSVIGTDATVHFRQEYASDATTSVDQKVLRLVRNPAGRWLITGEAIAR